MNISLMSVEIGPPSGMPEFFGRSSPPARFNPGTSWFIGYPDPRIEGTGPALPC